MYGRISDSGVRPYPPRVRRDLDVPPRGNSRRAPRARLSTEGGRGGPLDQWDWDSKNAGMKVICPLYYKGGFAAAG